MSVIAQIGSSSVRSSLIISSAPLSDKNWFCTGGSAEYYAEPTTPEAFQEALSFAIAHTLDVQLIGEGANMLISDEGIQGLVIRPFLKQIKRYDISHEYSYVEAQAGVSFGKLINWCLEHNLIGLEEFSGIPGTIGGAVFINIHYFAHLLSDFLIGAQVIEKATGTIKTVDNFWFKFGYNTSRLHQGTHYLLSATFKLKKVSTEDARFAQGRSAEIIRHRNQRYPASHTCGSFFRNFSAEEVAHTQKKLIYIAYYLDKIGIKGELSSGDAIVSYKHANMLVNQGSATSHDLISLARKMQQKVYDAYGMMPQPECRLLGFSSYPLLTV